MPTAVSHRARVRSFLLWAAPVTWLGCGGGGGTDVVLPSLSVTTTTQGIELDPDGYSLLVDGASGQPIGPTATLVIERLNEGEHTLELSGLASNCVAQGENPRTITIRSGATTISDFAVQCGATSGTITVSSVTTGEGSDPDGYDVLLDGSEQGTIGMNATTSLSGLTPGSHTVGLTGIAANCQVAEANPQSVTVSGGQSLQVAFSLTCSNPGPSAGTIQVTTSTSGATPDADGYGVSVDGGPSQPIGANDALALPNLSAGQHSLQLSGVAGNCTVSGSNPRRVSVPADGSVTAAFAVTCTSPPPGTGAVQITATTTGASLDPDGYAVAVDNAGARPLPINGSISVGNLAAGTHTVGLNGLAANCTVADNPRTVTVTAGQTTPVAFAITCTATGPTTGQIRITANTTGSSRDPDGYSVSVDGGAAQSLDINGARTFSGLSVGSHSVTLSGVATNCTAADGLQRTVAITAGQTAVVAFSISCAATGGSINLRIERMYLTQSTQTPDGSVPLVQGRDAYIRVFATASGANSVRPPVRVRFFQNGASTPTQTLIIPPGGGSTPTSVQEGTLGSSWNIQVPAGLIQPNTTVLADVDPDNAVAESNEGDNAFPATGTPRPISVRAVPPLAIQFVPITQAANGLTGTVGNVGELIDLARRMHPLNEIRTSVHAPYTTTTQLPLESSDQNDAWERVLEEIELMRLIEGTSQHYFGMVRVNYGAGVNGIGYVGVPSAVGSDAPADVAQVVAHELGHNWGRWHSPCGNPGGLDPNEDYPYAGGRIGVYGLDVARERLRPPSDPDIMGYCPNPWISDYTYEKVLAFRSAAASSSIMAGKQLSMIVWGRIQNGHLVLHPAFQVVTRPSIPPRPGPYTLEATAADGTRLFSLSFAANPVADKQNGSRHFAFAVPVDPALAAQVAALRLNGPGAPLAAVAQSRGDLKRGVSADAVTLRREGDGVTLQWDAGAHPLVVVRDPDTGEVLSLAREGRARIVTSKARLDLEVSDGVRSYGVRRAISR
ncbi:MAG TPA: hypothetical protein VFH24_00525 [Gemmatimonadales bacterium]|nr:hypothetical protein [Gemmatimonadales bacterium]